MDQRIKEWAIPAAVGIVSFAAGFGVGYFLLHRKFVKEIETNEEVIEELRSEQLELDFKRVELDREFNHMIQEAAHVIKKFNEDSKEYLINHGVTVDRSKEKHPSNTGKRTVLEAVPTEEDDTVLVNVFVEEDDDWDYEVEIANRTPDKPYIIHRDEFFSNEKDLVQDSVMYYAGDNILCDAKDVPIYNPDELVGELKFGHGSRDPNIVYIRNEAIGVEIEVLYDPGYYQTEILGQEVITDLKHARGVPKFRPE